MARLRKPWGKDPRLMRSLAHYQRNPDRVPAGQTVRIWSDEHRPDMVAPLCGIEIRYPAAFRARERGGFDIE